MDGFPVLTVFDDDAQFSQTKPPLIIEGSRTHVATRVPLETSQGWNARLPVHRLPSELLVEILLLTQETRHELDIRVVIRWSLVCSHWRDVITSTSVFWRRIPLECGPRLLDLILSRNTSGPLEIEWIGETASAATMTRLRDAPIVMAQRCRYIYANTAYREAVDHILHRYGPHATHIDLSFDADLAVLLHNRLDLPQGVPLERLALFRTGFYETAWTLSRLSSLKVLLLQDLIITPSTPQLYGTLAAASELEVLVLEALIEPLGTTSLPEDPPIITLPKLKLLFIDTVPPNMGRCFLTRVRAPSLTSLTFNSCDAGHVAESNMGLLSNALSSNWKGHELAAEIHWWQMTLWDRDTKPPKIWPVENSTRQGMPTPLRIVITLDQATPLHLQQAFSSFSCWTSQVVALMIDTCDPPFNDTSPITPRMVFCMDPDTWHCLVCLHLQGDAYTMIPFMRFLAKPLADTTHHALPNLFHLFVDLRDPEGRFADVATEVVSMAKTRYASVSPTRIVKGFRIARLHVIGAHRLLGEINLKGAPPSITTKQIPDIAYKDLIQP